MSYRPLSGLPRLHKRLKNCEKSDSRHRRQKKMGKRLPEPKVRGSGSHHRNKTGSTFEHTAQQFHVSFSSVALRNSSILYRVRDDFGMIAATELRPISGNERGSLFSQIHGDLTRTRNGTRAARRCISEVRILGRPEFLRWSRRSWARIKSCSTSCAFKVMSGPPTMHARRRG
jgi:hypothetical protein